MTRKQHIVDRFAANIRYLRKRARMTMQQLADEAGVHVNYICRIEAGVVNPSLTIAYSLARALNAHPDTLMFEDNDWEAMHDRLQDRVPYIYHDGTTLV